MNKRQREQLEARLKALPKSEQDRLFRQAAAQRTDDQKRRRSERKRYEDLDAPRPGSSKRKVDPVREYALRLLAAELAAGRHEDAGGASPVPDSTQTGRVLFMGKRRCLVRPDDGGEDFECRLGADLAGRQQAELCVGDRVSFVRATDERHDADEVVQVLPRKTVLTRRDPRTGEARAIVANVDAVVIVVSVVSPPLHPRLIDRYLIAIEDSWVEVPGSHADDPDPAQAIIAVNKIDLLDDLTPEERERELAKLEPYRAIGLPIVECAAQTGRGMDELRALLAGRIVAFVGHSGVGKSSITNALDERLGARTAQVGAAANRGRHTTTSSQLYEITPDSGETFWVIDTPGIRYFALEELTPAQLRDSMPELRRLRRGCQFNDCTHTHEPGCAVREAVERGELHPARYDTYIRLLEEIARGPRPPDERIRPLPDEA
ncbi:MAG: ribosome small subunit-dependent GTPase A [Phycisphaerales bacterium JB059]